LPADFFFHPKEGKKKKGAFPFETPLNRGGGEKKKKKGGPPVPPPRLLNLASVLKKEKKKVWALILPRARGGERRVSRGRTKTQKKKSRNSPNCQSRGGKKKKKKRPCLSGKISRAGLFKGKRRKGRPFAEWKMWENLGKEKRKKEVQRGRPSSTWRKSPLGK